MIGLGSDQKIPFFLTAIGDLRMAPSTIKACVQTLHCRFNVECEYREAVKICLCVCVKRITPLVITQQVVEQLITSREENVFAFVICICNSYLLGAVHK